jgi:murein DD-endopeptidase MepM/ murein hydrolase activator NlpD
MDASARLLTAAAMLAATLGPAAVQADTSQAAHTRAVGALPRWVRDLQAGELDVDRALIAAVAMSRARSPGSTAARTPGLAAQFLGHLVGPQRGAVALLGVVLEAPSILTARPVAGKLSSSFGLRRDPLRRRRTQNHKGIDIRAARNTPVHVAGSGKVVIAGRLRGYGRVIYVDHGDGLETRYAHLQRIGVRVGQSVRAGQVIGQVGSSGRSTGPHLHFEVRDAGAPVAPDQIDALPLFDGPPLGPLARILAPLAERGERMAGELREGTLSPRVKRARSKRVPPARTPRVERRSSRPQS